MSTTALWSIFTLVAGAAIGFLVTRLNEWILESRELRRAGRHLMTEAANIVRHYTLTRQRLAAYETEAPWRVSVQLEIAKFYGNGLGTFDWGSLRLFDETIAEEAMLLMIMIRNNNSYVEQAKVCLAADQRELFLEVCRELTDHCGRMIEAGRRMETMLRQPAGRFSWRRRRPAVTENAG